MKQKPTNCPKNPKISKIHFFFQKINKLKERKNLSEKERKNAILLIFQY